MRIALMGKGGSGKTTIAASLIGYLNTLKFHTIAIDADVNQNLADVLCFDQNPLSLSSNFSAIANYLEGNRKEIKDIGLETIPSFGSIPPSTTSSFIRVHDQDNFLNTYGIKKDYITKLEVGKHNREDFSNACYHAKLNSLEIVLHHLLDGEKDFVVVDSTAGIDNLGTSLFMAYDLTVFVVEPTQKSVDVFLEYKKAIESYGLNVKAIINKITTKSDKKFISDHINKDDIIGYAAESKHIYDLERGNRDSLKLFVEENSHLFEELVSLSLQIKKNWDKYLELLKVIYKKECDSWWSQYYGKDLLKIIDPKFSYSQVL